MSHLLRDIHHRNQAAGGSAACAVEVFTHPEQLPADVRQFMQSAEERNLGFGFDWYRNLVQTVYPGHEGLRLYVLRRAGDPVAVLPLRAERGRFGWHLHSLSNFYTTLYEPVLAPGLEAADLLPLLAAMRAGFGNPGSLMLAPMAPDAHAYRVLLAALSLDRWCPFEYFAFGNWYEPVRTDWPTYLAAREGSVRSTIKRAGKKFAAAGGTLEIITGTGDMPAAIAAYEKVYAASWKKPEPFPEFMPGLLRACAEKGALRLGVARLDGEPIAAQAWIVAHGRAEIYKLAYDEQYKQYAAGTLLTAMLMQHVMECDRVTEIDYLVGDDPYKKSWMSQRRERNGIVAYNLRSVAGLAGLARERLARAVKQLRERQRGARAPAPIAPGTTASPSV